MNVRSPWVTACCCVATIKQTSSGSGDVEGGNNRDLALYCASLVCSNYPLVGTLTQNPYVELLTWPLIVSHGGIVLPFSFICVLSTRHSVAGAGPGRCGHIPLYFGVGLELMRNAIATLSERTYQGNFGAWVDIRVRCRMPVFLERCGDNTTKVWHLFEYVAYAFATKKLRSATIESQMSAIKFFHRVSRGFELNTTHPVLGKALKGAARSHADAGNQATVRWPVSWERFIAGEKMISKRQMVHVDTAANDDSSAKSGCVGGRAGGRAEEYALHSLRIGGATHLSAGVATS